MVRYLHLHQYSTESVKALSLVYSPLVTHKGSRVTRVCRGNRFTNAALWLLPYRDGSLREDLNQIFRNRSKIPIELMALLLAFLLVDLLLVDLLLVAPLAVAPLAVDLLLVVRLSTVHARCRRRCTCRKSESGRTDP